MEPATGIVEENSAWREPAAKQHGDGGDDERDHQRRPGLHRAGSGQHENARADDGADAEKGQIERAERLSQAGALRTGEQVLDTLLAKQGHEAGVSRQTRSRTDATTRRLRENPDFIERGGSSPAAFRRADIGSIRRF